MVYEERDLELARSFTAVRPLRGQRALSPLLASPSRSSEHARRVQPILDGGADGAGAGSYRQPRLRQPGRLRESRATRWRSLLQAAHQESLRAYEVPTRRGGRSRRRLPPPPPPPPPPAALSLRAGQPEPTLNPLPRQATAMSAGDCQAHPVYDDDGAVSSPSTVIESDRAASARTPRASAAKAARCCLLARY